ncbi:MAG: SMP-30/gluconolactonase/LRE family protein [Candidatus Aminicenantes bacterium]|nr:SMP-30/gluconolactonase/LRE family protein [Candidatus Aminicenantes bacterium]
MVSFILIALCLTSSTAIATPVETSPCSVAFRVDEKDLIPAGIAHDPRTGQFFLSSINKRKVVAVSPGGKVSDFVKTGQDGVLETLGMKVDAKNRRLWVLSNEESGGRYRSAVHIFHVDTRTCLKKFALEGAAPQLLNDLVLTDDGSAYISDTEAKKIYEVPGDLSRFERLAGSDDLLKDANGIAISPDNATLYVAAALGITLVDIKTKSTRPIANVEAVGRQGIDGLVFYRDSLIAVVNGVKTIQDIHIARYRLSPDGREIVAASTIDKGNPKFNIPTTCVIAGGDLFVLANTSLDVYLQKRMNEEEKLQPPAVLKYVLSER